MSDREKAFDSAATMLRECADGVGNLKRRMDAEDEESVKRDAEEKIKGMPKMPEYNAEAVNKAIASSKQKIGGREASMIHRLLKGRTGK